MRLFAPIFEALNQSGTRYVVVGGVATIVHGYLRATTDVDIILDLSDAAARAAINALVAIGYKPRVPVTATDFANAETRERWEREKGMVVFSMTSDTNPIVVDLFIRSPVEFEALYERSEVRAVEGGPIHVASLDDLIELKQLASRPQDLVDITELRAIKQDREK